MAAQSHMVTHSHSGMPLHIQSALQEKKKQDSERRERQGKGKKKSGEGGRKSIKQEAWIPKEQMAGDVKS